MPDDFNDIGPKLTPAALENLQCNILRSTGKPRSTQVFRRFLGADDFKRWLKEKSPTPSTSSATGRVLVNLLFTAEALEWLGVAKGAMDPAFLRGSRDDVTLRKLGDGGTADWGLHRAPWHVVELYWHDADVSPEFDKSTACVVEHGSGVKKDGSKNTESHQPSYGHFGILDGISKLVYTQADYQSLEDKHGTPRNFDPRQKLSTLLVPDVLPGGSAAFGSYFVFRKIEQHVDVFEARIDAIAKEIGDRRNSPKDNDKGVMSPERRYGIEFGVGNQLRENIKTQIFGRGTDGDTRFDTRGNDFNYSRDADGRGCPFHAHIRKMNPRGDTGDIDAERKRAIGRRGTSYDKTEELVPNAQAAKSTEENKGLLFWCAQSNIGEQFEYIQEKWANSTGFDINHEPTPDVDTLIGRLDPKHKVVTTPGVPAHWDRWRETSDIDYNVWDAMVLKGAEYLYAPSVDRLAALKASL